MAKRVTRKRPAGSRHAKGAAEKPIDSQVFVDRHAKDEMVRLISGEQAAWDAFANGDSLINLGTPERMEVLRHVLRGGPPEEATQIEQLCWEEFRQDFLRMSPESRRNAVSRFDKEMLRRCLQRAMRLLVYLQPFMDLEALRQGADLRVREAFFAATNKRVEVILRLRYCEAGELNPSDRIQRGVNRVYDCLFREKLRRCEDFIPELEKLASTQKLPEIRGECGQA